MNPKPNIMFIAGDPSGDTHSAPVVKRILVEYPGARVWGIGGPLMQKEGFEPLLPFEPFNKMGFLEVARHLGFFLKAKSFLINQLQSNRPDLVVCVDYPGFNIPFMKAAKKLGIPVLWYIAPMVWAWKKKRAAVLAQGASHIACIFPFEVDYFKPYTENVSFVGNPLVEAIDKEGRSQEKSKNTRPTVAIVPGSRVQEIEKMLFTMVDAYKIMKQKVPDLQGVISRCRGIPDSFFSGLEIEGISFSSESLNEIMKRADVAMVKSGTATLETALMGIPHVIVYKTSWVSYKILKSFVKIKFIGLPNIISGSEIVPECIQKDADPSIVASKLLPFLQNRDYHRETVGKLTGLKNLLGEKYPSEAVFSLIQSILIN
jgi:lipid-A-disaccharide synthase